ncbi:MAG: hypothetical protein ABIJ56_19930 [Pseudomonadota bacterium]
MTDRKDRLSDQLGERGEALGPDFLSIDIEAQIRKLPSRTFRSPFHYPVELVRSALIRGAERVEVEVERSAVVAADNGGMIDETALKNLTDVFDPKINAQERLTALSFFEDERGIGLLAAFAPHPKMVVIETSDGKNSGVRVTFRPGALPEKEAWLDPRAGEASASRKTRIRLDPGVGEASASRKTSIRLSPGAGEASASRKTRIRIMRSGGDPGKERSVLERYCRRAAAQIVLNGREISGQSDPPNALFAATLAPWETVGGGTVWIPDQGDVCRLWLLDHGIRWQQLFHAPDHGLVYEAAVECAAERPKDFSKRIRERALRMYGKLAEDYDQSPPGRRERIEELFFLHYRLTRDRSIVDRFAPFRVHEKSGRLSLPDLRMLAESGRLKALPMEEDPGRYITQGLTVLRLTQRQWEFLAEHARMELSAPFPVPRRDPWHTRLRRWLRKKADDAVSSMLLGSIDPVGRDNLSPQERALIDLVSSELMKGSFRLPGESSGGRVKVVLDNRGRRRPGRLIRYEGKRVLSISRRNRHVVLAIRAVHKDPANIAMVLPMLTGGLGGWTAAEAQDSH